MVELLSAEHGSETEAGPPASGTVEGARRTEIGPPEDVDLGTHPVATGVGVLAMLLLFLLATLGLRVALDQGVRRSAAQRVVVPTVEGRSTEEAVPILEVQGLLVAVEYRANEVVEPGIVFDQRPIAGARLEVGSEVTLVVSDGPAGITVPDVRGAQGEVAASLFTALGLTPSLRPVFDDDVRPGEVVGTAPAPGNRAAPGSEVGILVSQGPAPRTVPAIVGSMVGPGLVELGRSGLGLGPVKEDYRADVPPGVVLATDPAPGSALPPRTPVAVVVSAPAPELRAPPLVGLLRTSAEAVMPTGLRLQVRTRPVEAGDPRAGRVIEQSVPPATPVVPGTPIEIVVAVAPVPPPGPSSPPGTPTSMPG